MAENSAAAMNPDFPQWYRTVNLEDNRDRVQRRWSGVSSLVDTVTRADVETMVRVVFRARQGPRPDTIGRIRQAFKDTDELFDMRGNDRELEVLCGTTLAILFEKGGDTAAAAALAVTTSALDGARTLDLPIDLIAVAEHAIATIAETHRKRPDLGQYMSAQAPKFDFEKAAAQVREQQNWDGVAAAFTLAASAASTALGQSVQRLANAMTTANRFIAIQDEELQMLWWLIGERSWDRECRFEAITVDAQPLVLAKELADLTEFLPGPASAKALLSRTGLKERKKLTLPRAINACDAAWLGKLVDSLDPSPVSQPIHLAIRRKLETGDKSTWVAGWAAAAGIEADHTLSALALGNLFYRERLLALFSKE